MSKPAINMATEKMRVQVETRRRDLQKTAMRYLTNAERLELQQCNAWLKKHPRAWE